MTICFTDVISRTVPRVAMVLYQPADGELRGIFRYFEDPIEEAIRGAGVR